MLDDVFTRLPDSATHDSTSVWAWPEARLRFVQSHGHSFVGRLGNAVRAQDAALAVYPASSSVGPAQVQLHRSVALIRSGDTSEAIRHAMQTMSALAPAHRLDGLVRQSLGQVFRVLPAEGPARARAATQVRELLGETDSPA